MSCQRCGSDRVAEIGAKCSDCCGMNYKNYNHDGYVPGDLGIGGGDYVEFKWCLECGQIQGEFPVADPELEDEEEWDNWDDIEDGGH